MTLGLGVAQSADQYRRRHRPWQALVAIFALVFLSWWAVGMLTERPNWFGKLAVAAANQDSLFSDLPAGWKLERQVVVPARQLATFSQRLGGELTYLSNNFLSDGRRQLQINELRCSTTKDADAVYAALLKLKQSTRWLVRKENTVFEFVARTPDEMRFAAEARVRLPILPQTVKYEVEFDAVPLSELDPMLWNDLFNLFLRRQQTDDPSEVDREIRQLTRGAVPGRSLAVRRLGLGENPSQWRFDPMPAFEQTSDSGTQLEFTFRDLPQRAGLPVVRVNAIVTSTNLGSSPGGSSDRSQWLQPTPAWPAADADIQRLAKSIFGSARTDGEKLTALLAWFSDPQNIRTEGKTGSRYGTKQVLRQKFGHCWDYADVMVTLARAADLPARQVMGWIYQLEGHVWCEVLVDGRWQHVDPTTGTFCGSDYVPLIVNEQGPVTVLYASPVNIQPITR